MIREEPLAYHAAVRDYLKDQEREVWQWYASHRVRAEHAETSRVELLKRTYRVERDTQEMLYRVADDVVQALALDVKVTIYQAQNPERLNASVAYLPSEAHVVLHGPVADKLDEQELRALLAHELGHVMLYEQWDGDLLIAAQVLSAMTHDRSAAAGHMTTARLFDLYTEVFCDRVAWQVVGDPHAVISMLVKITTGIDRVDPRSYLKQASEILMRSRSASSGLSHPESYLRAHVLQLWSEQGDEIDQRLVELIEGNPPLDQLDLIGQRRLRQLTRRVVDAFFAPRWTRTDLLLSHARLFFEDFEPPAPPSADAANSSPEDTWEQAVTTCDASVQDYCCYVLLDFASADRELEMAPLARALEISSQLGLEGRFSELAAKELRMRKKQVEQIAADRSHLLATAAASFDAEGDA